MVAKHGKHARPKQKRKKPARLAEKLLTIRQRLGMSQDAIIRHLGLQDEIERDYISKYERGVLEPTLNVLLAYAGAISAKRRGGFLEALIDDAMDLPEELPADAHKQRSTLSGRQISSRKKKSRS